MTAPRELPQGDRAVRRARAVAGAHPHLPADSARPVERARGRARRRAGGGHAARVLPLRRPALAAGRCRRDDGPLRPAPSGEEPGPRAGAWSRNDRPVLEEVLRAKKVAGMLGERLDDDTVVVHPSERGNLKQALLKLGWPAEDYAGLRRRRGALDRARHHRLDAARLPVARRPSRSGTVARASSVLPCGAGKTLVGAAAMAHAQATTLILVTNTVSARQWKDELRTPHLTDR